MNNEKIYAEIAISNRHVHLTEEVYNMLFDEPITVKKNLMQVGEFASNQTLTLKTEKGTIENVRVLGPFRKYSQVELAYTDAYTLGLKPPVRESGSLENSEAITLIGPKGEVSLENACIIAERHIHMNEEKARELGFNNRDIVKIKVNNDKGGIMEAYVKISSTGYYEIHIDRDDANAFLLNNGDLVEIEK